MILNSGPRLSTIYSQEDRRYLLLAVSCCRLTRTGQAILPSFENENKQKNQPFLDPRFGVRFFRTDVFQVFRQVIAFPFLSRTINKTSDVARELIFLGSHTYICLMPSLKVWRWVTGRCIVKRRVCEIRDSNHHCIRYKSTTCDPLWQPLII